tara:strand:+ start:925 stop:2073 length:1149 start_codon:yes stop_codon:yes gene_type:complete
MNKRISDMAMLGEKEGNINICYPYIAENAIKYVTDTLNSRWIGQGPKVEQFEQEFQKRFCPSRKAVAVGAGTDALHLAYELAGIGSGDEVIAPVFTCTATNIPFLYSGATIRFADVQTDTMNMDVDHVEELVNENTKAIVCVHYGGLPCDMDDLQSIADDWGIPIIEDAAHALGATYKGKNIGEISDYTMYSFQAIKHITTGDGGMLVVNESDEDAARRIRWFGIDRKAKQAGIWENDIKEIGYKYQMTDISAAIGLAALEDFDKVSNWRKHLFNVYCEELANFSDVEVVGINRNDREHAAWLFTILVDNRYDLQNKLAEKGIESNQMHFRNDRYSIFDEFCKGEVFPNMDIIENKYLVLPLHYKVSEENVRRVCSEIKQGW